MFQIYTIPKFTNSSLYYVPAPVFIVQYLFDEAQITVNNLIDPSQLVMERGSATFSQEQWEYLYKLGEHLKNTLHNVT